MPLIGGSSIGPGWINGQGITDSIRSVLSEVPIGPFTPNEVFKSLQEKGFDFSGHTQPMASIYKILSRLKESGEVTADKTGHKVSYTWKTKEEDIPF
jgi:Fe2+ or Zn2+ uptake regulation protein